MRHVADWLKDAVVGLAIGLLTGNWTLFQDKVVKPFVEAMAKLIQWIVDLLEMALKWLTQASLDVLNLKHRAPVTLAGTQPLTATHSVQREAPRRPDNPQPGVQFQGKTLQRVDPQQPFR